MKIFRELFIFSETNLEGLKETLLATKKAGWKSEYSKEFNAIEFAYYGSKYDKAIVFLTFKFKDGLAKVTNIIPQEKGELSIEEYNQLLEFFYQTFLYGLVIDGVEIKQPSSDIFDPLSEISKEALDKLIMFCNLANKSTGSSHPCDRERWLDFIFQTVIDERPFDASLLQRFLSDEDYWGKVGAGVIGKSAWSQEKAFELSIEYENYYDAMAYCKEKLEWNRG